MTLRDKGISDLKIVQNKQHRTSPAIFEATVAYSMSDNTVLQFGINGNHIGLNKGDAIEVTENPYS